MSKHRAPTYLSDDDEPINRVRCPIHGFIHYSDNERKIIDHTLFRRLRYIRQLALTELIYPGAVHTRFEHSLGVMNVATMAFDAIAHRNGELIENTIKVVAGFEDKPMAKARQALRLAALLHDVGHASFSHAAERVIFKSSSHEKLSVAIIKEEKYLGKIINEVFWDGCAEVVAQLIDAGPDLPPQLYILKALVSSNMDADRTDYLLRDSYHCGVSYGRFDYTRMVECLDICEIEDTGRLELALTRDGIHTFEALILGRYQMNTQVYYHRLRRIYDLYLNKYFESLEGELPDDFDKVIEHNDITMMAKIFLDAQGDPQTEKQKWASRIADRKHHKKIFETGVNLDTIGLGHFKKLVPIVQARFGDVDFLSDHCNASIHTILVPGSYDEKAVPLYLKVSETVIKQLGEESQVIQKIPLRFYQARIFADLSEKTKEVKTEIETFANDEWRKLGGN